jgi:hypothetical protein
MLLRPAALVIVAGRPAQPRKAAADAKGIATNSAPISIPLRTILFSIFWQIFCFGRISGPNG